jgi:hypothetical protein
MGYLGFKFNLTFLENRCDIKLNDVNLDNDFLIIFIEKENLIGNHIIGFEIFFKKDKCNFVFLKQNGGFGKFLFLENSIFKYGKISVSDRRIIDF